MASFARKISMLYKRPGYSWCLMGRDDDGMVGGRI